MSRPLMEGIEKFLDIVPAKSHEPLKDYTRAHPMMRQQYTYLDLKEAFDAGVEAEYMNNSCGRNFFNEWFKDAKFEMTNENRNL